MTLQKNIHIAVVWGPWKMMHFEVSQVTTSKQRVEFHGIWSYETSMQKSQKSTRLKDWVSNFEKWYHEEFIPNKRKEEMDSNEDGDGDEDEEEE